MLFLGGYASRVHCSRIVRFVRLMNDVLQDPISRIYAIISILMFLVSSILAITYNLAQDALLAAKTSRPFPYTSQMASSDRAAHLALHRSDLAREREFLNSRLETIVQSFGGLLESLDIPPPEVKNKLNLLDKRIHLLEMEFAVVKMRLNSKEEKRNGQD